MPSTKYILYQAYGIDAIVHEAVYSILTLYKSFAGKLPDDVQLVVYTDKQDLFQQLIPDVAIQYQAITPAQILEWRGQIDFVHRVKIKVIQHFFERYHSAVLYVDTDTCFLRNPNAVFEAIENGICLMHTKEYTLNDNQKYVRKLAAKVVGKEFHLRQEPLAIKPNTQMWNAGALGLPISAAAFLPEVLELTDTLYGVYPKHTIEQLAFSVILAQQGNVQPLDNAIYHYWDFKEFRQVLVQFFQSHQRKPLNELLQLIDSINPEVLSRPKFAFKNLPKGKRIWLKLTGRQWRMKI